ncbi:MAG: L-aspartate oxidase [Candidatus Gracilibacteria bacterium]|jgi:L-aspartate oxidase
MQTNFLIIGSGIAGLNFALNASKKGKAILITKKNLINSSTNLAQGGIAAVLSQTDSAKKHIEDTMKAGDFHNKKAAVEFMVKNSKKAVENLIKLGVNFERENGKLMLTREGGHSEKRIAYIGDHTGEEIEKTLIEKVKANKNIKIYENTFCLDLIIKGKKCFGAYVIKNNKIENIFADQTILATGGLGQIYSNTTNPEIATGDGIAIAHRAGAKLKDLEFIQFHPSAFDKNISPKFLISETVRGEGAYLLNSKKERFMENKHPLKELAPRSIVAREIFAQLKKGKVYLDIRHKGKEYLQKRFPQIYKKLLEYGIDMAKDLIPIIPAAHYSCGGITTDLSGKTNIKNLFAFGECSYTGVHGANRLASNSLLEGLVFSSQIIKNLKKSKEDFSKIKIKKINMIDENSKQTLMCKKLKKEIQNIMWEYCGIIRDRKKIQSIAIPAIKKIIQTLAQTKGTNTAITETKNMAQTAILVLTSAYKRKKSLGCHYVI